MQTHQIGTVEPRNKQNSIPFPTDIGANLTDGMFRGMYNGAQKHPDDLDTVLQRSWSNGLEKIIVTVGCLKDTDEAVKITESDGMCNDLAGVVLNVTIQINQLKIQFDPHRTLIFHHGLPSNSLQ